MRLVLFFSFLLVLLAGCKLPTLPERPNPIDKSHPLAQHSAKQVIWLWLPQTMHSEVINYRLAVDHNLRLLPEYTVMMNQSSIVQQRFEEVVNEQGGIFDARSGKVNLKVFNIALEQVEQFLAKNMPDVTDIIYVNIVQHPLKVEDGIARWHNTQQKLMNTNSTVRYTTAVSLHLHYTSNNQTIASELQGLDIQAAPLGQHNRYDFIIKRVLQPFIPSKSQ